MKYLRSLAILATLSLLASVSALARDSTKRTVTITDPVTIGTSQLKPGDYKVEWQGAGPAVEVSFIQNRKTVATALAKLQTDDSQVTQDAVVLDKASGTAGTLEEIDFAHQKEALVFGQSGM